MSKRAYIMLGHDPDTGVASRAVGVIVTDEGACEIAWFDWLDHPSDQEAFTSFDKLIRASVEATGSAEFTSVAFDRLFSSVNGVTAGLLEIDDVDQTKTPREIALGFSDEALGNPFLSS